MPTHGIARVVIGANFGDEGKGLMTDAYAADDAPNTLVVRFNGGGQAGHTVEAPDGRRHVFKHVGAGTLAGASTLLARDFIVNPLLFFKELSVLHADGVYPRIYVDPSCLVTTPYDMLLNKAIEDTRSGSRHGSCGVGINETVTRSARAPYAIRVTDLSNPDKLRGMLLRIRKEWGQHRLDALGVVGGLGKHHDPYWSDTLLNNWIADAQAFVQHAIVVSDAEAISDHQHIVFEGAQGLLLDEERGFFPHVTRSRTGVLNAARLAVAAGITELEVTYVTRAYVTRHGAGPLPDEVSEPPFPGIVEKTNVTGDYQGTFRYGLLDVDSLAKRVKTDIADATGLTTALVVAVTCVDQCPEKALWLVDGKEATGSPVDLVRAVGEALGASTVLYSTGASRQDVWEQTEELL